MVEVKTLTGKLNLDASLYRLPKEDYSDALNITHDAVEGSNDSVISNIVSNRLVSYSLPSGTNKTIGAYANTIRNTVIYFNYNSNGYHSIYEFNKTTRTITPILINLTDTGAVDILGFTTKKITGINIYNRDEGDLLFFLDSLGRPTYLDITLFKAGTYTPVSRDIIDLATRQPTAPYYVYDNNASKTVNYLRKNFFRFKYRWVLDVNFKSTYSPIGTVEVPVSILNEDYNNLPTNNNIIVLSMNSGDKDVKEVEVLMSYVEKTNSWSDFQLVTTINKFDEGIGDNTLFSYEFDNSSTYPTVDGRESILLFDAIPFFAKAQEMPNGDVLSFGAVTEGYDKDYVASVVNVINTYPISTQGSGTLSEVTTFVGISVFPFPVGYIYTTQFAGVPAVGTVITVEVRRISDSALVTTASYTTILGDNQTTIRDAVGFLMLLSGAYNSVSSISLSTIRYIINPVVYQNESIVTITPPSTSLVSNSVPVWKFSSQRNMGLAYYDNKGRTNGVLYNTKITFPQWAENIGGDVLLPNINSKIYSVPPIWAYSFQYLFTKDATQYLEIATTSTNSDEADFIYFEVSGLRITAEKVPTTSTVVSYSFQEGDILRLTKILSTNFVYTDHFQTAILGLLTDPTINGVTYTGKQFIKVKKDTNFSTANFSTSFISLQVEIYRPQQPLPNDENKTFYECGIQYPILNPGTATRVHAGEVTNQSTDYATPAEFNIKRGDSYFRRRTFYISDTGIAVFSVQDSNIVDSYISAVSSIDGRPNLIDINAKRAKYGATIRHGQTYQANTNINQLNRFYPEDFIDLDYNYGDIERLKTRDRFMRAFQTLKVGMIPIFSQINKSSTGTTVNVVTDKLLNPVQYYQGNVGIGNCPESLASNNYADYFVSDIYGAILRVSDNGIDFISLLYNVNSWATEQLPSRAGKSIGVFDRLLNNYVLSLEAGTFPAVTIIFDENNHQDRKGFESFLSLKPEMMVTLGTLNIQFKNGELWTQDDVGFYNNFFGVQYDSTITPCFNQGELDKKTFIAVTELASRKWDCPEIITSSNEYGTTKQVSNLIEADFEELESDFCASFLRASNSLGGLVNGSSLKGNLCSIKFRVNMASPPNNLLTTLNMVSVKSIDSPLNVVK